MGAGHPRLSPSTAWGKTGGAYQVSVQVFGTFGGDLYGQSAGSGGASGVVQCAGGQRSLERQGRRRQPGHRHVRGVRHFQHAQQRLHGDHQLGRWHVLAAGTIITGANGIFQAGLGGHTYAKPGKYDIEVNVSQSWDKSRRPDCCGNGKVDDTKQQIATPRQPLQEAQESVGGTAEEVASVGESGHRSEHPGNPGATRAN